MRYRKIGLMAALAGLGIMIGAVPSQAALTTFCEGVASDVTVPGDLVVARGDSCELTNVTIQGDATVRADANLLLTDAAVDGQLRVFNNGSPTSSTPRSTAPPGSTARTGCPRRTVSTPGW